MKQRHVCILSCAHPPDDGRVTHKIGRTLAASGVRVSWVGPDDQNRPVVNGIDFRYCRPANSRVERLAMSRRLFAEAAQVSDVDVYFAVEPDSAAVGVRLARERGRRVVFDIHEIYHNDMLRNWVPDLLRKPVGWLVRKKLASMCRRCDLLVAPGRTVLEPYLSVLRPALIVRHCLSRFEGRDPRPPICELRPRPVRIMHGKATPSRGTEDAVLALSCLPEEVRRQVRLVLFEVAESQYGQGMIDLIRRAAAVGVQECLEVRQPVAYGAMGSFLEQCDIGLIAYRRDFGVNSMPNRFFEFMSYGIPVVCPSYARELGPLVLKAESGVLVDTENPQALAHSLALLILDPERRYQLGSNGRRAVLSEYNIEQQVAPLLGWINDPRAPLPQLAR